MLNVLIADLLLYLCRFLSPGDVWSLSRVSRYTRGVLSKYLEYTEIPGYTKGVLTAFGVCVPCVYSISPYLDVTIYTQGDLCIVYRYIDSEIEQRIVRVDTTQNRKDIQVYTYYAVYKRYGWYEVCSNCIYIYTWSDNGKLLVVRDDQRSLEIHSARYGLLQKFETPNIYTMDLHNCDVSKFQEKLRIVTMRIEMSLGNMDVGNIVESAHDLANRIEQIL